MSAPTTELGRLAPESVPGWSSLVDGLEDHNPLFADRVTAVRTLELMLTDSQIEALRAAMTLPILGRTFGLYPNGAPAAIVERQAEAFGLPILRRRGGKGGYELDGEEPNVRSARRRFSFREHLEHALEAPFLGHYVFEQVYDPAPPGGKARLRKLAPRPPGAITEMPRAADGGLEGIRMTYGRGPAGRAELIPIDRLVVYSWGRRGANWSGRSMLRGIYREWLLKDRNLRLLGMRNQRAGIGIPTIENAPGTSDAKVQENLGIARGLMAGEDSGLSLPAGASVRFRGVEGSLPDILADVRYLDEAMARRFLAMVVMLGQTQTGSRALGQTFDGIYGLGLDALARFICDVFTEHVIEDDVDWNDGDADAVPYRPILAWATDDGDASADELVGLLNTGAIQVDTEVENVLRARHNLPLREVERVLTTPPPIADGVSDEVLIAVGGRRRRNVRPDGGWG